MIPMKDMQKLFAGAHIEPKWSFPDALENAPYFAMQLLLGGQVILNPRGRIAFVSIILDGHETVMEKEDFKVVEQLAENFVPGYLQRKGYSAESNPDVIRILTGCPSMIVDGIRFLKSEIAAKHYIDESTRKAFWMLPDAGACGHYRCTMPFKYMERDFTKQFFTQMSSFVNYKALSFFDVVMYNRIPPHHVMAMVQNLKLEGKTLVYETDDDLLNIPEWNLASRFVTKEQIEIFQAAIEMADVIFTTTPYLKDKLGRPEITHIAPNLIDMDRFKETRDRRKLQRKYVGFKPVRIQEEKLKIVFVNNENKRMKDEVQEQIDSDYSPIIILWSGSNTHDDDLTQIIDPIKIIGKEFGMAVKFVFFGYCPPQFAVMATDSGNTNPRFDIKTQYAHFIQYIPPVRHDEYANILYSISPDFCLCPLSPHEFNRSKSNIKPLEVGAMKIPSIVSSFGPYEFIKHNIDGIKVEHLEDKQKLTDSWVSAIRGLILNSGRRESLGQGIYDTVLNEYSWQTNSDNRKLWDKLFDVVHKVSTEKFQQNKDRAKRCLVTAKDGTKEEEAGES